MLFYSFIFIYKVYAKNNKKNINSLAFCAINDKMNYIYQVCNYKYQVIKIKPMNLPAAALQSLLSETETHPKIKQTLKLITQTRQKITYHGLVSSSETYLHLRGLANHDQQQFNYISKMLHAKIIGVAGKIKRKQLKVKDLESELKQQEESKEREEVMINEEMIAEVEHVMNNIDLPLSLFKRNDHYWYHDNPKTIEAKNYVYQRIKEDRERKQRIRSQIMKKQTQKQKQQRQEMQRRMKAEQKRRLKQRQQIKNHIEERKKRSQQRQKSIEQSQKYTTSLKPLFVKIQEQQEHAKLTALQEQKRRLNEVRKLNKSIDYSELEQHKNKLLQMQKQREMKKIINQPVKVSFKSKYHTSMTARSRINQYQTTKSLYQRKKQYGSIIKNQFKPKLDQNLVEEMEERLKQMKRKRVRKNPRVKEDKNERDQDDDEDDQQQKPQQVKKPQPVEIKNDDDDEDDSDDQSDNKRPPRIRGQDEDPDWKQRYQLGVGYLQYVRNLKKKKKQEKNNEFRESGQTQNSDYIKGTQELKTSERYKDYLRQFVKTNRSTIDHIDTKRMKNEYNKSILGSENGNDYKSLSKLENQTRIVQNKINRQSQLLKFRKMKNQQSIAKKVQIDNAVIQTIKARLALMGS